MWYTRSNKIKVIYKTILHIKWQMGTRQVPWVFRDFTWMVSERTEQEERVPGVRLSEFWALVSGGMDLIREKCILVREGSGRCFMVTTRKSVCFLASGVFFYLMEN